MKNILAEMKIYNTVNPVYYTNNFFKIQKDENLNR